MVQEHDIRIGHNRAPPPRVVRGQPWPEEAQALIGPRRRPVTTSGRAGAGQWVLRFERRTAPAVESLMGWTGGDDPLAQVEIVFDTREQAVAYAEREGVAYRVADEEALARRSSPAACDAQERETIASAMSGIVQLSLLHNRYGRGDVPGLPELERAFVNPAAVFGTPDEVVRHPLLTIDCKRDILWRWAWDEYLIDLAHVDGMAEVEPSRLAEVKAALRLVNTEWSPDPAAPAAFVVHYRVDGQRLAA